MPYIFPYYSCVSISKKLNRRKKFMHLKSPLKNKLFYFGVMFIGLLTSILYSNLQKLTGDQTQMLYKGYLGAYEGVWLSYGNAASAVGNVPGSLSAWLIGGPLLLWDSPYAPMVLLLANSYGTPVILSSYSFGHLDRDLGPTQDADGAVLDAD